MCLLVYFRKHVAWCGWGRPLVMTLTASYHDIPASTSLHVSLHLQMPFMWDPLVLSLPMFYHKHAPKQHQNNTKTIPKRHQHVTNTSPKQYHPPNQAVPVILPTFIPLLLVFVHCRNKHLTTSREIKRLDATTRSPVFANFSATLKARNVWRFLHHSCPKSCLCPMYLQNV